MKHHTYEVGIEWTGNDGQGTKTYTAYRRNHTIVAAGKPSIPGSSDPNFRGDPTRYNPEELLVASLSACHMLWYLHLCAINKVTVRGLSRRGLWRIGGSLRRRWKVRSCATAAEGDDFFRR